MVLSTIEELKQSALYKQSDALKSMSARQLTRFVEVFAAVASRVLERGGGAEEAERTALAIALSTARRVSASVERTLEAEVHFFAAMAPQQFGGGADGIRGRQFDFTWIVKNPDLASLTVAGNEFNWDHERHTTALGQVRGIVLAASAPAAVREKVHKDIPFLFVASYYTDVDADLKKIDTISAEWAALGEEDGVETPLPLSFAITRTPLNGPNLGIQRVASWSAPAEELATFEASLPHEKVMNSMERSKELRGTMPNSVPELETQVASLTEKLKGHDALKEAIASFATSVKGLGLEGFASLSAENPAAVLKTVEASLKKLAEERSTTNNEIKSLKETVASMQRATAEKEANEFAAGLVQAGKIKSDAAQKWAGIYVSDKETAKALAEGLASATLGAAPAKGRTDGKLEDSEAFAALALLDPRFAKKEA